MIKFKSDYAKKILYIDILDIDKISSKNGLLEFKSLWCDQLKHWHSPYKALINFSLCASELNQEYIHNLNDQNYIKALERLLNFFYGFHLKKAVCYGLNPDDFESFPIMIAKDLAGAYDYLSISRNKKNSNNVKDLSVYEFTRTFLAINNDLDSYLVELSFEEKIYLNHKDNFKALKSKLINNMVHWHSFWCLLIDFSNISSLDSCFDKDLSNIFKFFNGFFLKSIYVYNSAHIDFSKLPLTKDAVVFTRSRHKAMTLLKDLVNVELHNKKTTQNNQSEGCVMN